MAMHNPSGRANYEPNSWTNGGPRADPQGGFRSFPEEVAGDKRKVRSESFADHYSQARQFYVSQTEIEQGHIADALTFELSKVVTPAIRERMVAHLPNIDAGLAEKVAEGLGLDRVPEPHTPARAPISDLPVSDALSILKNAPGSFAGRKMGVLLTDGVADQLVDALKAAVLNAGGVVEFIAPRVGGVVTKSGAKIAADQMVNGAPSVLYDAVAILATAEGAAELAMLHAARTFVADAFAHAKFIGLSDGTDALLDAVGEERDGGVFAIGSSKDAKAFVKACRDLRFWDRVTT